MPGSSPGMTSSRYGSAAPTLLVEFLNRAVGAFLDGVTEGGKKLD